MAPAARGGVGARPAGNLPMELTSFIGRRRELSETRRLMETSRLVTLTGIGGVGKTRLALRVANAMKRAFVDGIWFVELGDLHDSDLVADAVSGVLGLRQFSQSLTLDSLVEYCADRNLLLVIDNCEHMVDSVASLTGRILRKCARVKILATSRESLGISGEITLQVPPLATPDSSHIAGLNSLSQYESVSLFTDRAKSAVSTFTLTENNKRAVIGICQKLDGLPLPIELAAARLRGMTVEQIIERLTDRYLLLTLGGRDAPTRQQTLRFSIDWSYDLCSHEERKLWENLAVFSGGFEIDAVEYVCGNGITSMEILNLTSSLVDKSILIRGEIDGVVRYRLLDLLRDYGQEKLRETGDEEDLRRRHHEWFEELVLRASANWISDEQKSLIARLTREQLNINDALEFALSSKREESSAMRMISALQRFWIANGLLTQASHWMRRALAAPAGELNSDRLAVVCGSGIIHGIQGDKERAVAEIEEGRKISLKLADTQSAGIVEWAEGYIRMIKGESAIAVPTLVSSLARFRSGEDMQLVVGCLDTLGMAYLLSGDIDRAAECHHEVLAITEENHEVMYRSYSLCSLGLASWLQRDLDDAVGYFEKSLEILNSPMNSAWCIDALAWIAVEKNNSKHAARLLGASSMLWKKMGTPPLGLPEFTPYHENAVSQSRAAVGNTVFEKEFREGFEMNETQVFEYVLSHRLDLHAVKSRDLQLTPREQQVAELVALGLTNRSISEKLVISLRTAQGHVEHILRKLGFTSRSQIAAWVVSRRTTLP